jgi:hypothetical protein
MAAAVWEDRESLPLCSPPITGGEGGKEIGLTGLNGGIFFWVEEEIFNLSAGEVSQLRGNGGGE